MNVDGGNQMKDGKIEHQDYIRNIKEKAMEGDIMKPSPQSDGIRASRDWGLKFDETERRYLKRNIIKESKSKAPNRETQQELPQMVNET